MCLTIPMRVESVEGLKARCQALGVTREVSLFYLQHDPPTVGDYVMVHLGQAMQRVSVDDAQEAWRLYGEIMAELGTPLEKDPLAGQGNAEDSREGDSAARPERSDSGRSSR